MKTSLLSLVAILGLFVTTAASATTLAGPPRYPSPRERARYEAAQRHLALERARLADQRRATERARFEALRRHDKVRSYGYGYGRR